MARGFEVTTGLVIQQGIFEASTTSKHRVGTRMQLADGRVFHYARAGGALAGGMIAMSEIPLTAMDLVAVSAMSADAKSCTITQTASATFSANDFAEGYLVIQSASTGAGQCAKIKSHGAIATTSPFAVELHDPMVLGVAGTPLGELIRNPFMDVVQDDNMQTGTAAGVPLVVIGSGSYGWLQTWGTCALLAGGDGSITDRLIVCATTGEVTALAIDTTTGYTGTPQEIGHNLSVTLTDTYYHATYLTLFP